MPRLQLSSFRIVGIACGIVSMLAVIGGKAPGALAWVVFGGAHVASMFAAWCVSRGLAEPSARRASSADVVLAMQVYFALWVCLGILFGSLQMLTAPVLYVAVAALSVVALLIVPARCMPPQVRWKPLMPLAPLILIVLWQAVWSPEYVYDTLTYHLFFPARWVQDHAISIIPTWCGGPIPDYAPSSTEVYYAALMLPFGADWVARGGQFPYWVLMLASTWAIGRELRLRRSQRVLVTFVVAALPGPAMQAATALVDVALAAHLLCVVLFGLRLRRTGSRGEVVGLLLSLGAFVGTKFLAIAFLVVLAPLIVWCLNTSRAWLRVRAAFVTVVAILAFAIGPSWHLRNWLVTGNPVYPMEVRVAGATVFSGVYGRAQLENSLMNARRNEGVRAIPGIIWRTMAGDEPMRFVAAQLRESAWHKWVIISGALLAMLAFLVVGMGAWYRRDWKLLAVLSTSVLLLAAFWWLLPFQDHRFAIGPMALMVIGVGCALRGTRVTAFLPSATVVTCAVIAFSPAWVNWLSRSRMQDARTRSFASVPCECEVPTLMDNLGKFWSWCDTNLHDANIAYCGTNIPYFLLGRSFENRVQYIPATQPADGRFHDFAGCMPRTIGPPNTAESAVDRYVMNPREWLANLRAKQIDYVIVHSVARFRMLTMNIRHDRSGYPIEQQWLTRLCERGAATQLVDFDQFAIIYKLNRRSSETLDDLSTIVQSEADAFDFNGHRMISNRGGHPEYPLCGYRSTLRSVNHP